MPVLPPFPITEIDLKMPASSGVLETAVRCGALRRLEHRHPLESVAERRLPDPAAGRSTPAPAGPPARALRQQARVGLAPTHSSPTGNRRRRPPALLTDADGIPVPGETVEFSSTDPGQQIGPVIDNEDGTYSAAAHLLDGGRHADDHRDRDLGRTRAHRASAPLSQDSPSSPASPPRPSAARQPKIGPIPKRQARQAPAAPHPQAPRRSSPSAPTSPARPSSASSTAGPPTGPAPRRPSCPG